MEKRKKSKRCYDTRTKKNRRIKKVERRKERERREEREREGRREGERVEIRSGGEERASERSLGETRDWRNEREGRKVSVVVRGGREKEREEKLDSPTNEQTTQLTEKKQTTTAHPPPNPAKPTPPRFLPFPSRETASSWGYHFRSSFEFVPAI